jgi:putative aminopeptidase FrvX
MHTPVEMIAYADLDAAVELIVETIRSMKKDHDFTPR